ncbi:MAG: PD40 domain-containing protein [Candidatus Hydrogenedentes bacterium]|nr:PD40 domain-containing protein [Candidatus Hydrogenedentota bacterium]
MRNMLSAMARAVLTGCFLFSGCATADIPLPVSPELLADPVLTAYPIVFVTRKQYRPDHHNTETMFQKGEINEASFEGGGALKVLEIASGRVTTLLEAPDGIIRDPDVSFDGQRILFSMRRNREDDYHIYEINADGTDLRQLTRAAGVTDIDPLYLPDGRIAFSSTRQPKYCMCNRHIMANLFRMDGDGANIHQIGKSTLFEGHGALLPDGRILYYRWEYVDRNFGDAQGLWTVHPDGTGHAVYWGNNTNSPGAVFDARPIPGADQTLCIFGSCHDRPWGALAIIDRRLGLDGRAPVARTWPESAIDLVGIGDFDTYKQVTPRYEDAYPLTDSLFLCAREAGDGELMGIFAVHRDGRETLVHVEPPGCYDPIPLAPRTPPTLIPDRRDFASPTGAFYVADVYRGTHMAGVGRGAVKYLRVVESPEKRFFVPEQQWGGQGQQNPAMNWHDFNNKRILGTVPVEEDGSAYFDVPAETFVYFQLLDANGMMVQSMRSGTIIQPGETQGCTGCHENRLTAPPPGNASPLALRRAPSTMNGWHGEPRLFSYAAEVQPVFDKHCAACHDFGTDGGERLILAGDKTFVFNASYEELWRRKYISVPGAGPAETQQANSWGSHASKIVQTIRAGHHDVQLSPEEFDRIVTWIDLNAPYYPTYASVYPDNLAGRSPLNREQVRRLGELTGIPFESLAGHTTSRGPLVSFDRPELSPCLAILPGRDSPACQEALRILEAGREQLRQRPREDMPGAVLDGADLAREAKYEFRAAAEKRAREVLRLGSKHYDD